MRKKSREMVVGRVVVLNPPSNLFHNPSSAASLIPPHTRLLSFSASAAAAAAASSSSSANRTRHTPTTKNDSPFSTFGRVKTQKPKTLLHRSRDRRRTLQVEEEEEDDDDNYGNYDDNDDYSAPRRGRPSQSGSRSGGRKRGGWDIIPRFPSQAESTTDTNFFSLKSFKEIGCADYIIQSLQKIFLTRPSHVQVPIHSSTHAHISFCCCFRLYAITNKFVAVSNLIVYCMCRPWLLLLFLAERLVS